VIGGARRALRLLIVAGTCAPFAQLLEAQSIEPPIVVLSAKVRTGTLVIANPTLYPLAFVLEPFSFTTAENGDLSFQPLDTVRVRLQLSAMSGRIPPRQQIRIQYVTSGDSLPAWFAIVASFNKGAAAPGLGLRMQLVQTVYLMQRERALAEDLAIESFTFDARTNTATVRIVNRSAKLTRLSALRLVAADGKYAVVAAGPIFPNSTIEYVGAWTLGGRPHAVNAVFDGFSLTQDLTQDLAPVTSRPD
jgi:hypothetical protein